MCLALATPQLSSRHVLPGSITPLAPESVAPWIPGTSPGMTKSEARKLIGISLKGYVG
jgi:hypothetical protein